MLRRIDFKSKPQVRVKARFYDVEDLITAAKIGILEVGHELATKDIDGEAIFEVADIRKKKVILCRKHLLKDAREMGYEGELLTWLDNEYYESLPAELREHIVTKKDASVFLPKEVEVFGKHEYSDKEEKGKQWAIFKNVKKRIRLMADGEHSRYWWLASPYVGSSTYFCGVNASGAANYSIASASRGVLPCFCVSLQ